MRDPNGRHWPVPYANLGQPPITLWELEEARKELRQERRLIETAAAEAIRCGQTAEFGSGVCMGASYSLCCRCRPGVIRRYRKSVAGKATTASRNVDVELT